MKGRRSDLTGERVRLGASLPGGRPTEPERPSRINRRERGRLRRRLLQIAGLIVLSLIIWQGISPVRQIDLHAPDQPVAQAALDGYFTHHSRRNGLISSDDLAQSLTLAIPNAVNTRVSHDLVLSRLAITVTTQQPALRWQTQGVQYTVSDHGIILDLSVPADAALPIIFDEANVAVAVKEQVVPKDFADFIVSLESEASSRSKVIRERYIRGSTRELRAVFEGLPYYVRFDTQRRAGEQLDELVRLEQFFASSGQRARDHVDLRIPGRAYWE